MCHKLAYIPPYFCAKIYCVMCENIKLSREILGKSEYLYAARFKLFVTLLFLASKEDCFVDGEQLKRGELVTSIKTLSERVSLTVKQVRLALAALKKAGVITTRSSNIHTVVSICNFDSYTI